MGVNLYCDRCERGNTSVRARVLAQSVSIVRLRLDRVPCAHRVTEPKGIARALSYEVTLVSAVERLAELIDA